MATVFGATGFFGRYVVFKLGPIGSQCVIPYRGDGEDTRHLKLAGDIGQIIPVPCSLLEEDDIRRAVARSNVVINLLGANHETRNYSFDDANVKCVYRIAKVCAEFPNIQRFVHVSGLGANAESKSAWERSKAEGEKVVRMFHPNATIMRPAPMWGKEDKFLGRICDMANWAPFIPTANFGKQKLQPVSAIDVAQAIMSALASTSSQGKTYELGGPQIFEHEQLLNLVCDEIYQDPQIVSVPEPVGMLIGKVCEHLPKRWRLLTTDQYHQMCSDKVVSKSNKIGTFKDLLIEPAPLEDEIGHLLLRHRGWRGPQRMMGLMGKPNRHPDNNIGVVRTSASQAGRSGHGN